MCQFFLSCGWCYSPIPVLITTSTRDYVSLMKKAVIVLCIPLPFPFHLRPFHVIPWLAPEFLIHLLII
jgi:hypothetical protein